MTLEDEKMMRILTILKTVEHYQSCIALLNWDQEVNMPLDGVSARSAVYEDISGKVVDLLSSPDFIKDVTNLYDSSAEKSDLARRQIAKIINDSTVAWRVPKNISTNLAGLTILAQAKWSEAKLKKDYSIFSPYLDQIVRLKREEAEYIGYDEHPYDALLGRYEKGITVADMDAVFNKTIPVLKAMRDTYAISSASNVRLTASVEAQKELLLGLVAAIGLDLGGSRIDFGKHPATEFIHPGDVRIIARLDEHSISSGVFLTIHEVGHAIYYQNINTDLLGTGLFDGASTCMHEAAARFMENNFAKSVDFLRSNIGAFNAAFSASNSISMSATELCRSVNAISKSPLRFDADELSYVFHIYIRYTIEKELMLGELSASQVPNRWNELFSELLNISVPDDSAGCLQDVHWACALFGYFPTYYIGTIYAAALFEKMQNEFPDYKERVENHDYAFVVNWMREHVYQHGAFYSPAELMENSVGESNIYKLSDYFIAYIGKKYKSIFDNSSANVF